MEESSPGVKGTVCLRQNEQRLMERGKEVKADRERAVWRYLKKELITSWWRWGGKMETWEKGGEEKNHDWRREEREQERKKAGEKRGIKREEGKKEGGKEKKGRWREGLVKRKGGERRKKGMTNRLRRTTHG